MNNTDSNNIPEGDTPMNQPEITRGSVKRGKKVSSKQSGTMRVTPSSRVSESVSKWQKQLKEKTGMVVPGGTIFDWGYDEERVREKVNAIEEALENN